MQTIVEIHLSLKVIQIYNMKYARNILKRIERIIIKHNLITEGDRVLVALSGGKDSLALLEALAESKKNLPVTFDLMAIHVLIRNMGYVTDINYLDKFCQKLSIPFVVKELDAEPEENSKKGICFICSWYRRKAIFDATREFNCNKLAFGHHMDDALETLFMNMMYHGSISSLPYALTMFEGRVQLIRPLLELTGRELERFASECGYKRELKVCPYAQSVRSDVRAVIESMAKQHKIAPKNIFRAMSNIHPEYLPGYHK